VQVKAFTAQHPSVLPGSFGVQSPEALRKSLRLPTGLPVSGGVSIYASCIAESPSHVGSLLVVPLTPRIDSCRRWASSVHSINSNCPTGTGFSHNVECRIMPYRLGTPFYKQSTRNLSEYGPHSHSA
jgi:hypothetical protein